MWRSLAALTMVALLAACGEKEAAELFPSACHLPSPSGKVDTERVPEEFLVVGETVVRDVMTQDGLLVIALNIPLGVTAVYEDYLAALDVPDYQVISSENEGFEAEIYLRNLETEDLVAIQFRNPGCVEAVSGFVTIGRVGDPVGKSGASSKTPSAD